VTSLRPKLAWRQGSAGKKISEKRSNNMIGAMSASASRNGRRVGSM
jgi:hypothetical protein